LSLALWESGTRTLGRRGRVKGRHCDSQSRRADALDAARGKWLRYERAFGGRDNTHPGAAAWEQKRPPAHVERQADPPERPDCFTHLAACITEDDGGFTVEMSLSNQAKPGRGLTGEEIVDSIETASALLDAVAKKYSIPQARIKIRVRMENAREGTRH